MTIFNQDQIFNAKPGIFRKLITNYKIVKAVWQTPMVPKIEADKKTFCYTIPFSGFQLTSLHNQHNIQTLNDPGLQKIPKNYKSAGFTSWIIYKIAEYRYKNENWGCILNEKRSKSKQHSKLCKKIEHSQAHVQMDEEVTYISKEFGGGSLKTSSLTAIIDGYRVTADQSKKDYIHNTYRLSIFNNAGVEKVLIGGAAAKEIFLLLTAKAR